MADVSKIKVQDVVYDLKDSELRHMLNVLLGIEPVIETSNKENEGEDE